MKSKNTEIVNIEPKIYTVRGIKVMLDSDLALLYGVPTKRLNEAVKRNKKRFPERFMFRLTKDEWQNLKSQIATSSYDEGPILRSQFATFNSKKQNLKSQIVTSSYDEGPLLRSQIVTFNSATRKYLPYVFTEHGVTMLSSVLNSPRAIEINIRIIDAFIALRRYALAQKPENMTRRMDILEKALLHYIDKNDEIVKEIVETINEMLNKSEENDTKQIGFIKE